MTPHQRLQNTLNNIFNIKDDKDYHRKLKETEPNIVRLYNAGLTTIKPVFLMTAEDLI